MTLEELEAALPQGFHDAELLRLEVDYVSRTARFYLEVWVGSMEDPPGPERESRRSGILELSGLQFIVVEPPDARYPFTQQPDISEFYAAEEPVSLPDGAFHMRTFVSQWNSFIRVAALDASIEWLGETARPGSGSPGVHYAPGEWLPDE